MTTYHDPWTSEPADSLAFYRAHRHHLGEIVDATVNGPRGGMRLRDLAGNEIHLSGAYANGRPAAARAAYTILRDAGFPRLYARPVLRGPLDLTKPLPAEIAWRVGLRHAPRPWWQCWPWSLFVRDRGPQQLSDWLGERPR